MIRKKESLIFHPDIYYTQLVGLRLRLDLCDKFIKLEKTTGIVGPDVEFVCLQFRKLLEEIAMLSLIANYEEYAKVQKKFAKQWNAKKILNEIKQINPNYYPVPATIEEDEKGQFISPIFNTNVLTEEDFIELYSFCSNVIHAHNPYGGLVDPRKLEATFSDWYEKIKNLIWTHVLVLYELDFTIYGKLHNEKTGRPYVDIAVKISNG